VKVFAIGVLPAAHRSALSWRGRLKGFGHGWKRPFMPNAAACEACPEEAIRLVRA
jgi:hypothetical protein